MPENPNDQGQSTVDQWLARLEAVGGGDTEKPDVPKPIGVPKNYAAARTRKLSQEEIDATHVAELAGVVPNGGFTDSTTSTIAAQYFDGDEYMFATASPETIARVQYAMVGAGLLKGDLRQGVWDDDTSGAFKKVLAYANRAGLSWSDALNQLASSESIDLTGKKSGGGARGPVLTVRVSNPDDLRNVFKQTAYNVLGGKFLADDQIEQMISTFQGQEAAAQRAAFNAQVGGGGQVVDSPNAQTFAQQQVEQLDPAGAQANKFAGYVGVLERLLNGGAAGG